MPRMMAPPVTCPNCGLDLLAHLGIKKVAGQVGCSDDKVLRLLSRGELAGFRFGSTWNVCPQGLQRYVRDHHNLLGKECA